MTAGERTGWRDRELSRRHRRWGFNCPGVDLDFILIEYHLATPVALVDYKHHDASFDLSHPTYQAVIALADRPPAIPFLIARYWPTTWAFHIISGNTAANDYFGPERWLSEAEYVGALHRLRSLTVERVVLRHLNQDRPPRTPAA